MTQIATTYAQALYDLAKDEQLTEEILHQLQALRAGFGAEPDFVRLLSAPNLSKEERCRIVDDSFRGKVHTYVLSFLKLLTEKGYARHFADCCQAFEALFNTDHGILIVEAVTAAELTAEQRTRLTDKLAVITGKTIQLRTKIDPAVLGGIRLDYDGKRVDGTVQNRLESIRKLLQNTVL